MCFDFDSRPPELPAEFAPIAGGAPAELLTLQSADGTEFSASLAAAAEEEKPGVVIIPDVRGLHPFYVELAERFAQAGHSAIAFDFYGRTAGLGPRGEDFDYQPHREQANQHLDRLLDDLSAAGTALRDRAGIEAVVSVGFCFGGSISFVAGASPDVDLSAVIGFYGVLDPARFDGRGVLAQAANITRPVLGLFGGADQAIPAEQVEQLDAALDEAGVEHEIHAYPGAPHSFFDKKQDEFAEESEDAWRRILGFLAGLREQAAG